MQTATDTAVGVLWALTGRRFGCCPVIARPNPRPGHGWYPILENGQWRNVTCNSNPMFVRLPGPVCEITDVTVDGTTLTPTEYQLEGERLYRTSGYWPTQDLNQPLGTPGTWSVTYLRGTPPPAGADRMVAVLAVEFYNACTGGKCRLPRRVQTVTRQGVTVDMLDVEALFEYGATGITELDLWVHAHNPHRHRQPPAVSSPDWPGVV